MQFAADQLRGLLASDTDSSDVVLLSDAEIAKLASLDSDDPNWQALVDLEAEKYAEQLASWRQSAQVTERPKSTSSVPASLLTAQEDPDNGLENVEDDERSPDGADEDGTTNLSAQGETTVNAEMMSSDLPLLASPEQSLPQSIQVSAGLPTASQATATRTKKAAQSTQPMVRKVGGKKAPAPRPGGDTTGPSAAKHGKKKRATPAQDATTVPVTGVASTLSADTSERDSSLWVPQVTRPAVLATSAASALTSSSRPHRYSRPSSSSSTSIASHGIRSFRDFVRAVLPPEDRVGGPDAIADALLHVRVVELQQANLRSSSVLESVCTSLVHCYLPHNHLRELEALQLAVHLTVLVVHHNELSSLEDVADLPSLTILDASYNRMEALNPEAHLPCQVLRCIDLRGNPCSPQYATNNTTSTTTIAAEEDLAYVSTYRRELLRSCPNLINIDGTAMSSDLLTSLGFEAEHRPLLVEMAQADEQVQLVEGAAIAATGLHSMVTDEDFLSAAAATVSLMGDAESTDDGSVGKSAQRDDRRSKGERHLQLPQDDYSCDEDVVGPAGAIPPTAPPSGAAGFEAGGGGGSSDDETHAKSRSQNLPVRRQPSGERRGSSQQGDHSTSFDAAPELLLPSMPTATTNSASTNVTLTDRLLRQYARHQKTNEELVQRVVEQSNAPFRVLLQGTEARRSIGDRTMSTRHVFDPELRDAEDDDDDEGVDARAGSGGKATPGGLKSFAQLTEVHQEQSRLRNELRVAQRHHSDVAVEMVRAHWADAESRLRERHAKAQERRLELRERLSRPSAGYLAALELLQRESGCSNLDKYRLDASEFAATLIATHSTAPAVEQGTS